MVQRFGCLDENDLVVLQWVDDLFDKGEYPFHSRCLLRVEREDVDAFGENDLRPVMSDRDEAVVREKNWAVVASVGRRCWVLANRAWSPCPRH